jgi:hypothetical protein
VLWSRPKTGASTALGGSTDSLLSGLAVHPRVRGRDILSDNVSVNNNVYRSLTYRAVNPSQALPAPCRSVRLGSVSACAVDDGEEIDCGVE